MAKHDLPRQILAYLQQQAATGIEASRAEDITANLEASRPTVNRYLAKMTTAGAIVKLGSGPATRYSLPAAILASMTDIQSGVVRNPPWASPGGGFLFSAERRPLITALTAPIGTRKPVGYLRTFLDSYVPNQTRLLPIALAEDLFKQGRARGQQPAGTYARKVLEQLLIDLSWHSSRLEGNRKSLLDTREIFARGHAGENDLDALMLLNHKEAIEFIVDAVPEYGMTEAVVRNIQAMLMQGLLSNPQALGQSRRTVVTITDSVYVPMQVPQVLDEMLGVLVDKVRNIKNPIEAAFFLWLNIAYLQPFEDGNKRTSRLCANLPLLLQNCAPLSFLDVEPSDYALAVLAVYEKQDVSLAAELFEWTYRRSIDKYAVVLEAMGAPDRFRQKYRELLGEAVRRVVADHMAVDAAMTTLSLPTEDISPFAALLRQELTHLAPFNCARYKLGIRLTEEWIAAGRPGV